MERKKSKTFAYVGAGIGLTLFALFGLMYGSFLGGIIGLQINGQLFESAADFGMLQKIVVILGVMFGVLLAAIAFVAGSSLVCYLLGCVVDVFQSETKTVTKSNSVIH